MATDMPRMTIEQFRRSLSDAQPPDLAPLLQALWHDAGGDWERAHAITQDIDDDSASWVHAYLHRKEGDPGNAAYWYRRARKPVATDPLDDEWARIVLALLEQTE